jgi:hypothetical protein
MRIVRWSNPIITANQVYSLATRLQSTYIPGFTDAFVEGQVANQFTPADLKGLPDSVAAQVRAFLQPGIGSSGHTVLAPLFRPGASKPVIADNYYIGIKKLMRTRMLGQDSAYTGALSNALELFLQNGGAGALTLPTVAPSTALDSTIQQAASLAFK